MTRSVADQEANTLLHLSVRMVDRRALTYGNLNRYLSDFEGAMSAAYKIGTILDIPDDLEAWLARRAEASPGQLEEEAREALETAAQQISAIPVHKVSYNSPFEIVLNILPWGAPFAAAKALFWVWRMTNRERVAHEVARLEIARIRAARKDAASLTLTESDWQRIQSFMRWSDRIALEPAQDESED